MPSVGWPDVRRLVSMVFPWNSISNFGRFWVLISYLCLILVLILVASLFLSFFVVQEG